MDSAAEILNRDFDLRYRPKVGDVSYYRLNILYRTLDSRGLVSGLENYRGDFRRVVDSVDQKGKVYEEITWRNMQRQYGEVVDALSEPEPLTWADNFSYRFSAEDGYEDFHWNIDAFPKDLLGWNALLLTVDAHFEFDFLRSSLHGDIEKLRRIGDNVLAPDSNKPFALLFPPIIEAPAFNKQNLQTTFAGLTVRNAEPCGLLAFDMDPSPFTMKFMDNEMEVSSSFAGTIAVRLSDGAVEYGEFLEFVFNTAMPGAISAVYEITRIEEGDYEGSSSR